MRELEGAVLRVVGYGSLSGKPINLSLAEEALRARRFPGVAFRGSDWNRRPWVIGTGLDVWEIVAASRSFSSPQDMTARTDLTEPQIQLALAYYEEFPEEIEEAIRESQAPLARLQREFPTVDTITAD